MKRLVQSCFVWLFLLAGASLLAQNVKGTITDEKGEPLPGASVVVKGQAGKGAATDLNGKYTISDLQPGEIQLEFSFIGFEKQTKTIQLSANETKVVNAMLKESSRRLDEVVVVGYGVQRKRNVTGNIVSLDGKEVRDMPAPSFEVALQGKAPGVQISTSGGMAGSASVVRVRGIASVGGGGDPLYIVDGVQINQDYFAGSGHGRADAGGMNQNPLAFLNPDDIESVEVLKDASATAIYGSRGANGVIIITTKRGAQKGLRFNFSTTQGVSLPTNRPEMFNGREYLDLYEEAWINDGNTGVPTGLPAGLSWNEVQNTNTDWVDETIRTGYKQFYDFGVEYGKDKYNFYAGVSYDANQSYIEGDQYNRLSGRFNGDYRFSDKLSMSLSTNLTQGVYYRVDNGPAGGLGAAMSTALPIYPIRYNRDVYTQDPDNPMDSVIQHRQGDYWFEGGVNNNPTGLRDLKRWRNTEIRSINNLSITYSPFKNFTLTGSGSYDYSGFTEDLYEPLDILPGADPNIVGQGIAKRYPRTSNSVNLHGTASYIWDLNENHSFNFMVGTEYVDRRSEVSNIVLTDSAGNFSGLTNEVFDANGPFYDFAYLRDSVEFDSVQLESQRIYASYFGRVNYAYKNKYLAQVVLRADGSSSFGPENRFGFFPSVSGGWIISDEKWMKYNRVINYLKLKSSIGFIGNSDFAQNQFISRYNFIQAPGYNNNPILFPINAPNPDLKWETTEIFDLGLEFGLWEDRITGEIAYYRKNTRDVLMRVQLPRNNGFTEYFDNVGGVLNYGVEFSLSSNNITTENFSWKTDFNIAFNRNRITSLGGYSEDAVAGGTNDTRVVEGESVGTFYMVPVTGIDPSTGLPIYRGINGEPTNVYDQANRVPVGKGIPDAIGGITNTFNYKNWTLSTLLVFSIGADVYDHSAKYQQTGWPAFGNFWNFTPAAYDRWTRPGEEARLPRLTLDNNTYPGLEEDFWNTSLWVQDASYLRLRNVTISYNFDRDKAQKIGLEGLSIALIGTNLLTFTEFTGLDPEVARDFTDVTDRNMSLNTTYLTAPQEQTYSIRINANF